MLSYLVNLSELDDSYRSISYLLVLQASYLTTKISGVRLNQYVKLDHFLWDVCSVSIRTRWVRGDVSTSMVASGE